MIQTTTKPASDKQVAYIRDLASQRDHMNKLDGQVFETIFDVLGNVGSPDPKFISSGEARAAIKALLGCRPLTPKASSFVKFTKRDDDVLAQVLATLPTSRYALPRRADMSVFDFFELREAKNGKRYVNQLLGSPGSWNRKLLPVNLQLAAVRAIATDVNAAAHAYCTHHGRCCRCDAVLSQAKSIALAVGPVCRKKMGW